MDQFVQVADTKETARDARFASGAVLIPAERKTSRARRVNAARALLVALVGVLVCVTRSPAALEHPQLWAEDGRVWFKDAYQFGWLTPLGQSHAGYLQTFPRLIADVGLHVPLLRLPLLFVVTAVFVQILPAVVLASDRMAALISQRSIRLVVAALYLAIPNSVEVNANLTDAEWHLGVLAILVVLARPTNTVWRIVDVIVLVLSGLTGPFGLALLPIVAFCAWRRRDRWSSAELGLIAVLASIQAIELATSHRGHVAPLGASLKRFVEIVGGQIVIGSAFGNATRASLQSGPDFLGYSIVFLVVGVILVGLVLAFAPIELKLFNGFVGLILAASLFSPLVSAHVSQWQVLATQGSNRYWLFPALALFVDLLWLATRRAPILVGLIGVVLLCAVVGFGVREDWRYPAPLQTNWAAQVRRFERTPKGKKFVFTITPARWTMTLVKK